MLIIVYEVATRSFFRWSCNCRLRVSLGTATMISELPKVLT